MTPSPRAAARAAGLLARPRLQRLERCFGEDPVLIADLLAIEVTGYDQLSEPLSRVAGLLGRPRQQHELILHGGMIRAVQPECTTESVAVLQ